jgi:hypothetical protein
VIDRADHVQVAGQRPLGFSMQLPDVRACLESILTLQRLLLSDPEASVPLELAQPRRTLRRHRPSCEIVLGQEREPSQEAQHRE